MRGRAEIAAVTGVLALAAAGVAVADPSGLTVWKGQGIADTLLHDQHSVRFDHLSEMHFANGRSAFSTIGGDTTYVFSGSRPDQHGRTYRFAVDTLDVGQGGARKTYQADGTCVVDLKASDGPHAVRHVGCGADAQGGPSLSVTFIADKTPPDFKSFDPPRALVGQSGKRGG